MALSGTFYGTTANEYIKPKITWSAKLNIPGNYSDITATLTYSRTNTGYTTEGDWSGALSIGSSTGTATAHLKIAYGSDTVAITHTARVYHDSYGRLSLTVSAQGTISGASLKSTAISQTVTLDTIDRESTVSAVPGDIGSRSTVVVSRKNDGFTHSIAYSFGSLTGYLTADGGSTANLTRLSATTVNFLLPESFYYQIPNSPTGTCTLICTTWSGTTQIGQPQTAQFKVTAARSACQPVVSGTVADINDATAGLTGDAGKLVRFMSTARCTVSAQGRYGATIRETRIGGKVVWGTLDIPNADLSTVEFQATDSRGYTATCRVTPEVIPYILLTNNSLVQRTDPTSGNAELILAGYCWRGNFGTADNILEIEYQVEGQEPVVVKPDIGSDHIYRMTVQLTGMDYQSSYGVRLTARDRLGTASKTLTLNKGIPVFDWGESDFQFHVPVTAHSFNGAYIRTVYLADTAQMTVQTAFAQFEGGTTGRQSFFIFGCANSVPLHGLATIWHNQSTPQWSGTGDVTVSYGCGGQITLTMPNAVWGDFVLISSKPFEVL